MCWRNKCCICKGGFNLLSFNRILEVYIHSYIPYIGNTLNINVSSVVILSFQLETYYSEVNMLNDLKHQVLKRCRC